MIGGLVLALIAMFALYQLAFVMEQQCTPAKTTWEKLCRQNGILIKWFAVLAAIVIVIGGAMNAIK